MSFVFAGWTVRPYLPNRLGITSMTRWASRSSQNPITKSSARLASLHWLQRGEVRQLRRYYQDAMTSCCPSRRTSFPSLGDTSVALVKFAPWQTSEPPGPGVGNPVSPSGMLPRKQQDLPSSWGTSIIPFAHVPNRRRQDCLHQTIKCSSVALGHQKAKAPTIGSFDAQ